MHFGGAKGRLWGLIGCVGCERGTRGKRFLDSLADSENGGAISGNGNHKRKSSGCNEEMSGSVVNNVLWEILLEMSNRQLDSPRLKKQI